MTLPDDPIVRAAMVTDADLILAALDDMVAAIELLGVPVTRNPGDFQPPGVIVDPPTLTGYATMRSIGMHVPVYVVSDEAGQSGFDWRIGIVTRLLPVFQESAAEPVTWNSPINPAGLPAYLITVRANVANLEEGS